MKITRAGDYAVRCVLYLAKTDQGRVVPRKEISAAMNIPSPFLGKIAQSLARDGIIEIVQGTKGGYRLLESPERISLLSVIESVMGQIMINDCIVQGESCTRVPYCSVHGVWNRVRSQIRDNLDETSMADLADESVQLQQYQER